MYSVLLMTKIFQKENSSLKSSYEKNIIGEQSLKNINLKILNVVRVKIV